MFYYDEKAAIKKKRDVDGGFSMMKKPSLGINLASPAVFQ
jgi:hypothetical protein